jgi:hypothetical protein
MNARVTRGRQPLRLRLGLAGSIGILLAGQQASAAPDSPPPLPEGAPVVILPPLCKADSFPLVPFVDSLRVELAGRGLSCCTLANPVDKVLVDSLLVRVEMVPCMPNVDRVQVSAHMPSRPRAAEREISLTDVAQTARPRALALAVAELIRALGQGPRGETPETVTVPDQVSVPVPIPSPSELAPPVVLSLHAEAEVRGLPTRDTMMWGGRARFTAHWRKLHADVDLGADATRARGELGDVLLRSASMGIGLGPRFATRFIILDIGPRVELGWAWIHGEAAFADVRTGAGSQLISGVGFRVSLEGPAQLRIRPNLTLESGAVVRGVKAEVDNRPVAGMTGYYLLAAVGLGVSL